MLTLLNGLLPVLDGAYVQMNENQARPLLLIGRYTAAGALGGLLVGALEGMYRYRYPDLTFLLRPNVSYVILFLGPLVYGLAAGLIGMVTGMFVASRSSRGWRWVALILGVCLVTILVLAIAKNRRDFLNGLLDPSLWSLWLAIQTGVLLTGSVGAFIVGRILRFRTLSVILVAAFATLLTGVGAHALCPSLHGTFVAAKPAGPMGEPNIILITLDTLRADHLSLYGYPRRTTPGIDKWAARGVVFDNAIAPSSWTLPSHASMFTGLLPHQHGADFTVPLDPSWWTLAEVLSSWGYETAGFTSNIAYGGTGWGLGNGFEVYDDDSTTVRHSLRSLFIGRRLFQPFYENYVHPDYLDRRDARQINRDVLRWFHYRSPRPFYLFINYFDVHEPYLTPATYPPRFGGVPPWLIGRIYSLIKLKKHHLLLPSEDTGTLITGYDNCLAFLDDSVAELLDSLSRLPGWENTIVIITSDHGEGFGEHGSYGHSFNLYKEVLHVPLIIWGPNIPAGLHISHLAPLSEIFETVLQLAGMHNPTSERSSLQRFWRPGFEPAETDEPVISELGSEKTNQTSISLTTPEWHYLHDSQGNEELYRWVSDPGEKVNVANSHENQGVLKDLQIQLRATVTESFRPWEGVHYLSALGGPDHALAHTPPWSPELNRGSAHLPRISIGTSQAFFPQRAPELTQRPSSADEELLQSLPYQ